MGNDAYKTITNGGLLGSLARVFLSGGLALAVAGCARVNVRAIASSAWWPDSAPGHGPAHRYLDVSPGVSRRRPYKSVKKKAFIALRDEGGLATFSLRSRQQERAAYETVHCIRRESVFYRLAHPSSGLPFRFAVAQGHEFRSGCKRSCRGHGNRERSAVARHSDGKTAFWNRGKSVLLQVDDKIVGKNAFCNERYKTGSFSPEFPLRNSE
jgi:hypothetical protein